VIQTVVLAYPAPTASSVGQAEVFDRRGPVHPVMPQWLRKETWR